MDIRHLKWFSPQFQTPELFLLFSFAKYFVIYFIIYFVFILKVPRCCSWEVLLLVLRVNVTR